MSIISKELLSEVLQQNVISVYERRNQHRYKTSSVNGPWTSGSDVPLPNIYELANRCKEWAHSQNFMIQSYLYNTKARADLLSSCDVDEKFQADTEPEAVFRACEWILKEQQ